MNPLELPRDDSREFFDYWLALRAGWRLLAGCALTAALVTFVITEFMMTPYYRATALLRPVAEQSSASQLQGMLTGSAGALSGMLGGLTEEAQRAQEYLAILRSYQFTLALVNDNGLAAAVDPPGGSVLDRFLGSAPPTQWQLYEIMQKRFDCDYDRLSGNLSLYFLDPDGASDPAKETRAGLGRFRSQGDRSAGGPRPALHPAGETGLRAGGGVGIAPRHLRHPRARFLCAHRKLAGARGRPEPKKAPDGGRSRRAASRAAFRPGPPR